jgi:hypothetical protein
MKKTIVCLAVALALPTSVAFAKSPHAKPGDHGKSAPKVMYVLKGTLSAYTAYDASTSTNGQISITVNHSNYHGRALKGQLLTFAVTASTKLRLRHGMTAAQVEGAKGMLTVKAPKRIAAADLATTLQTYNARHVIVQKTAG